MNNFCNHACLVFVLVLIPSGLQGQTKVSFSLKVVRIDPTGEQPVSGIEVFVMPKYRPVTSQKTDGNGVVEFDFRPAETVRFRIGTFANQEETQLFSGRFTQKASYIFDFRNIRSAHHSMSVTERSIRNAHRFLDDFRVQTGGRLMNGVNREYLQALKPGFIELATPGPEASPAEIRKLNAARRSLLAKLDHQLDAPWTMNVASKAGKDGAVIINVNDGGPAERAGIKVGDTITHVNGIEVAKVSHSFKWLVANANDENLKLKLKRDGESLEKRVTLLKED